MQVFISWSGDRSKKTAEIIHRFLPVLVHSLKPWMSDRDIDKGERWSNEIDEQLQSCDIGVVCLTPENLKSPWLNFEAGALSKQIGSSRVMTLLMGMHVKDLDGPLSRFQATRIEKEDFYNLLRSINDALGEDGVRDHVLNQTFERFWPDMEVEFSTAARKKIDGSHLNIESVVSTFGKFGLPEPTIGNHIHFSSGFESHKVYSAATRFSSSRLWVWGRKNRKLFDKDHLDFFQSLRERLDGGLDFRLLFLDPESPKSVLDFAHQDPEFEEQLSLCIHNAITVLGQFEVDPSSVCRLYSGIRSEHMVIVDDAILHSSIQYDANGYVRPLTRSSFSIIGSESPLGRDFVHCFEECWERARPLR